MAVQELKRQQVTEGTLAIEIRLKEGRKRLLVSSVLGLLCLVLIAAFVVVIVSFANGDYAGNFPVKAVMPSSTEGIVIGSPVVFRGVQIGHVAGESVKGNHAILTLVIDHGTRVPQNVRAEISPENAFGADQVELVPPQNPSPYFLHAGQAVEGTTLPGVLQLVANLDTYLKKLDLNSIAATIDEAARSFNGEASEISQGIKEGASLGVLLASTLNAQLRALDSFTAAAAALRDAGPILDSLSVEANPFLTFFEQQANNYARALSSLTPFAQRLASYLSTYNPDLAEIIDGNVDVSALLALHRDDLVNLLKGVLQFMGTVKSGLQGPLPDGTYYGNFVTFISLADINQLICGLLSPPGQEGAALAPLRALISSAGTPLSCPPTAPPPAPPATPAIPPTPAVLPQTPSSLPSTAQVAQQLLQMSEQALSSPVPVVSSGLSGLLSGLLGGGS